MDSSSLAGAGSMISGLSGLTGMVLNPIMQSRQNEWNASQMRLQNQWNVAQWNRENAYNSPLAQMQRLAAAGINPALAYTSGLTNEAAASPVMQASQGDAPQVDVSGAFSLAGQLAGIDQQRQLIASQANLNNAKAEEIVQKLPEEVANLQQSRQNMQKQIDEMNAHIGSLQSQIREMDASAQLKIAEKANIEFHQTMATKEFELRCKEVLASVRKMQADAHYAESAAMLNENRLREDVMTFGYRLLGFDLANQKVMSECRLTQQMIVNAEYDGAILGVKLESDKLKLDQTVLDTFGARGLSKLGVVGQVTAGFLGAVQLITSPLRGIIHVGL